MTFVQYVSKAFVGRFLAVLLAFAGLLQLLDLLDKMSTVLERGQGAADLLSYVGLRLPLFVNQLVPLAVLIGALTVFLSLAQRNEIVALRSVGASPWRFLGLLGPAVTVIVLLHGLLLDQGVPRAELALQDWWAERPPARERTEAPAKPVWMLAGAGAGIVSIATVEDKGRRLAGVTIVPRDDGGQATGRTVARSAEWEDGRWTLRDAEVLIMRNGTQKMEHQDALPWPEGPSPANVAFAANPTQFLPLQRILSILEGDWSGTRHRAYYETQMQKSFAIPASSFVMLLLAQPALHGIRRSRRFGSGIAVGLVLGLTFLLCQGLLSALGEANTLPPAVAAWFPPVLFAVIGGAVLVSLEE
ncbi:LptF/LptG family permease [Azospirillum doebereinerae]